ncbi:MAG: histidine kinase [Deltaproteobacteria bacterium]|nr:histidine kinase [Deltaproteobacteria bacterium]
MLKKGQIPYESYVGFSQEFWESENRLHHLSSQLLAAQENERRRIARELHDSIGQSLAATKFILEKKLSQLSNGSPPPGVTLKDVIPMIQKAIEESRRISMDLWPSVLDDLGILSAISWFCRQFEAAYERGANYFLVKGSATNEEILGLVESILSDSGFNLQGSKR